MARPSVEAERREQILAATCEMIAERGYRKLRIGDVAVRAGLSSASVHYYFDSKQTLLREAFEFNFARSLRRRTWLADRATDPVSRLRLMITSYLPRSPETVQAWRVWVELWVSALGESELQVLNDSVYGRWRRTVHDAAQEAADLDLLDVDDLDRFVDTLIALVDGLAIQVLIGSSHMTMLTMQQTCLGYLASGLTPAAAAIADVDDASRSPAAP